jgi:hypothetical protein
VPGQKTGAGMDSKHRRPSRNSMTKRQRRSSISFPLISKAEFSEFVVFVDESGDHGLERVDPRYPLFVLAFCIFHKKHYVEKVSPSLQNFKFKHFGHDLVVLHEHEIRKEEGDFKFKNAKEKNDFLDELSAIIDLSRFIVASCVVKKPLDGTKRETAQKNLYHLALKFCLQTLYEFHVEKQQDARTLHVVFECRGKKEDDELELEFLRIVEEDELPFKIVFADKKTNSLGLQLVDLVARPIGLRILRPEQQNRTFEILKGKFFSKGGRKNAGVDFEEHGLKTVVL